MHYVIIFDAAAHPYRNLGFLLPGVAFMMVGALLVFRPEALGAFGIRAVPFFRWFFLLFAVLWTAAVGGTVLNDNMKAQRSLKSGDCKIVEGRVEHFHPMPWTGHDMESIDVNGVQFSYSDYVGTAGFNNTESHGGPIREGMTVRICYREGEILRLEAAH